MFGLVDSLTLTKSRRTQSTAEEDDDMMIDDAMIDAMILDQTTTASNDKKNNKNNGSSSIRPGRRGVRRGYQGATISSSYTMTEEKDSTVIKMIVPTKTQDGPRHPLLYRRL